MKKIIIITILICFVKIATAHNGTLKGNIIDAITNEPLEHVLVTVPFTNLQQFTDALGKFQFSDIKAGNIIINTSIIGYQTTNNIATITNHETSTITIKLDYKSATLQDIKISSNSKTNNNILQKIDLQLRSLQSSQDILKIIPGLFIAQHAGGGKAEQIFIRGFDADHGTDIAISADGMPVNMVSHAHGQGYADLHYLIPETIAKLNVQKGPYQAKNGDFSTAGAIEFITKNNFENNTFSIEKGMYNYNRLALATNLLKKHLDTTIQKLILATEYIYTNSYFNNPSHLNRLNLFSKYTHQLNSNNTLTIQGSYFNSFWNGSGQIPLRAIQNGSITRFGSIDSTEGGHTNRTNISIKLVTANNNNSVFRNQFFINNYQFKLYSNFTFFKNDTVNGDEILQKENRMIYGYNGSYTRNYTIHNKKITTELGVQLRYDNIFNSELSNVKQRYTFLKPITLGNIAQGNGGLYVDNYINIATNLQLNIGARIDVLGFNYLDKINTETTKKLVVKSLISPKLNLYYTLNKNVQLYALSGKSFHSNDSRVVIAQNGNKTAPTAIGTEIGVYLKPITNAFVNISIWQLQSQQEFVYVGDEAVVALGGASQRTGLDLSCRYSLHKNIIADVDFNFARAKDIAAAENENNIPLAPKYTSTGGLQYQNKYGLQASLRYRYLAERAANNTNTIKAIGYTLLDANIAWVSKKIRYQLSTENVLNTAWREAQFETETQLKQEKMPISEIHFTSGTPLMLTAKAIFMF